MISIVIPVYNGGNYIVRCLDSIKSQTYRNLQIIVIDDCSKDKSTQVISEYIKNNSDLNFKFIQNKNNLGLSGTRNVGMDAANGDFIFFMDMDDELSSNESMEHLFSKMDESTDICIGKTIFFQNNIRKENSYHELKNTKETYIGNEILDGFFCGEWSVTAWNKLYRRSFLVDNNLKFMENLLHEDELWAFETSVCAKQIRFLNEYTYNYYAFSNKDSLTSNIKIKNFEDLRKTLFIKLKTCKEKDLYGKSLFAEKYILNFARNLLSKLLGDKKVWKSFYVDISRKFSEVYFPNRDVFRANPEIAFWAYKMKYDKDFFLYGKIPVIVNKFL